MLGTDERLAARCMAGGDGARSQAAGLRAEVDDECQRGGRERPPGSV